MLIGMLLDAVVRRGDRHPVVARGFSWALAATIILPLSGWATLRVLDRLRLVRRGFGVLLRRLRFRREVHALRRERELLVVDVVRVVDEVRPRDLEALFPPGDPRRDDVEESRRARRNADLDAELDKRETKKNEDP
jgi:hypothetical protein